MFSSFVTEVTERNRAIHISHPRFLRDSPDLVNHIIRAEGYRSSSPIKPIPQHIPLPGQSECDQDFKPPAFGKKRKVAALQDTVAKLEEENEDLDGRNKRLQGALNAYVERWGTYRSERSPRRKQRSAADNVGRSAGRIEARRCGVGHSQRDFALDS